MSPSSDEIALWIRDFVVDVLLAGDFSGIDPLSEQEHDSLALEQLIDALEEQFHILLDEEEISRENFQSVPTLAGVVHKNVLISPWRS